METGMCATCMNCSAYFRKVHKWKSCSKLPLECGDCFDGYVKFKFSVIHNTKIKIIQAKLFITPNNWINDYIFYYNK